MDEWWTTTTMAVCIVLLVDHSCEAIRCSACNGTLIEDRCFDSTSKAIEHKTCRGVYCFLTMDLKDGSIEIGRGCSDVDRSKGEKCKPLEWTRFECYCKNDDFCNGSRRQHSHLSPVLRVALTLISV